MAAAPIPNHFVFVWDDNFLPYTAYLAMRAAANRAAPDEIHLLKIPEMNGVPNFERLRREVPCLRPIDVQVEAWLESTELPCWRELCTAHGFLKERKYHSAVSDLLRALYLYLNGGVYLDTDVISLRPFTPLLAGGGFVAQEHILVDSRIFKKNSPWRFFRTAPLTALRNLCSRGAWGVALFQTVAPLYTLAVHNATMGFRPRHPLMRDLLLFIADRYRDRPKRYSLLGPDAIQDLMAKTDYPDVQVLPPRCFSPLGPVMTYQYFHARRPATLERLERRLVHDDTYAIHWSNNGTIAKVVPKNDEDLAALKDRQLFSRLAASAIGEVRSHLPSAGDG